MSEDQVHVAILDYLRAVLPHGWLIKHVPNKPRSKIQGGREKRMGAIKGWPDLEIWGFEHLPGVLPYTSPTVWVIEVKAQKGRVRPEQSEVHDKLKGLGFPVGVARSIEDARSLCRKWGLPLREAA